jgi:hypothetical protein
MAKLKARRHNITVRLILPCSQPSTAEKLDMQDQTQDGQLNSLRPSQVRSPLDEQNPFYLSMSMMVFLLTETYSQGTVGIDRSRRTSAASRVSRSGFIRLQLHRY